MSKLKFIFNGFDLGMSKDDFPITNTPDLKCLMMNLWCIFRGISLTSFTTIAKTIDVLDVFLYFHLVELLNRNISDLPPCVFTYFKRKLSKHHYNIKSPAMMDPICTLYFQECSGAEAD